MKTSENNMDEKILKKLEGLKDQNKKTVEEKDQNFWAIQRQAIAERVEKKPLTQRINILRFLTPTPIRVLVPAAFAIVIISIILLVPYLQKGPKYEPNSKTLADIYTGSESDEFLVQHMDEGQLEELSSLLISEMPINMEALENFYEISNDSDSIQDLETMSETELNNFVLLLNQMG